MNVLGSHNNYGRGCVSCHPPYEESFSSRNGNFSSQELWGDGSGPYSKNTVSIDKNGYMPKGRLSRKAAISPEVAHVLLCLSCHDGNIAPENMMLTQSYEEFGEMGSTGHRRVPTLRGSNPWIRSADHPVGPNAVIPVGNGLQFVNGEFSVVPGSLYAQFVANYGFPTLASVRGQRGYGINGGGKPYLLCTTCHNPHGINAYLSRAESPIAGDGGGRYYVTAYSLNAPYNPDTHNQDGRVATSNTQFCRQCHFELSNEANNTFGIPTRF